MTGQSDAPGHRSGGRHCASARDPGGRWRRYGLTFRARATRIATIPVGYADGLPRCLGNRGAFWIAGVRAPIVGRPMDSITLDVTDVPPEVLYPGAPVE
jgi:alanine racemase